MRWLNGLGKMIPREKLEALCAAHSHLLEGMAPLEIMSMAAKASAIAVSRPGAADSIPTKDEVVSTELELK